MAARKISSRNDAKKGEARFTDQVGQWKNTTPAAVRRRQAKDWKKLEEMMRNRRGAKK